MFAQFQESFHRKDISKPCLTYKKYIEQAPIIVIDCSR